MMSQAGFIVKSVYWALINPDSSEIDVIHKALNGALETSMGKYAE